MTITLNQTDQNTSCGTITACATGSLSSSPRDFHCDEDATFGTTEETFTLNAGETALTLMYQSQGLAGTWQAGDWHVDINVTTAEDDITLTNGWLCRVDPSGCSTIETVTSETFNRSLATGGVETFTFSAPESTGEASDTMYVVFEMENSHSHTDRTVGMTPDQTIQTPVADQDHSVITNGPTAVEPESATLEGTLSFTGYDGSADVWFEWGELGAGFPNTTTTQTYSESTSFSETVSVDPDTEYEYRAHTSHDTAGDDQGDVVSFWSALEISGTVTDTSATAIDGATVYLFHDELDDALEETTDGTGSYSRVVDGGYDWHVAAEYDDGTTEYAGPSYHSIRG